MARNCTCDGVCQCAIIGGEGIVVEGSGNATDPYVVALESGGNQIQVDDTPTVDLNLDGDGSTEAPYTLTAEATVAFSDLTDVEVSGTPNDGDTPVWSVDHWEAQPPSTVPPGAVSTGDGLAGDGSAANPLAVRVSGTWGVPPLDGYGADPSVGQPTYLDDNGDIRVEPKREVAPDSERISGYEVVVSETDPGNPAADRIWIQPV